MCRARPRATSWPPSTGRSTRSSPSGSPATVTGYAPMRRSPRSSRVSRRCQSGWPPSGPSSTRSPRSPPPAPEHRSSSRSCTAPRARTARCRACSSSRTSRTSVPGCWRLRSPWTRSSPRRCSTPTGSPRRDGGACTVMTSPLPWRSTWSPTSGSRCSSSLRTWGRRWASARSPTRPGCVPHSTSPRATTSGSSSRRRSSAARSRSRSWATSTPVASVPGEIRTGAEWYDYSDKYDDGAELVIPGTARPPRGGRHAAHRGARVPGVALRRAGAGSTSSRSRAGGAGWSTRSTRCPASRPSRCTRRCGRRAGLAYPDLIDRLVELAIERHERRRAHRRTDHG